MDGSNDPRHGFYANPTVDELIAQRPEDEPIEEFLAALRQWRGHDKSDRAA